MTRLSAENAFDQANWEETGLPYLVQDVDTFEFGLQRILDGIEAYVEKPAKARKARER